MIREHLSKIVVVALMAVVVGVPFALQPSAPGSQSDATATRELIVYTPHNEQIRHEFARGFNAHRKAQGKSAVAFDWRAMGGTSDLRKIVLSQFEARAAEGRMDAGIGADLFFGGGAYEHNQLAAGVTVKRAGETLRESVIVPIELPDGMLERVFPSATIGGERLYHPERRWLGAAVSSFGIIYNRDVLQMLGLREPGTWSDLAEPSYTGWVALSDPAHSGSIAATYNTILRRHGWMKGWAVLRRVFANARYFTSSSAQVPVDVSAGEAAAGMCIDFYGRFQSGAIGGDRVGYVDPRHMTATTPDPISILRGAPHRELARQFVIWVLSKDGQRLWQRKAGAPNGPKQYALRRQPVRPDLYRNADETAHWTDPKVNPFATAKPVPDAMPGFYPMVAPVAHAMAIDVHAELTAAWAAIQRTPADAPRRKQMLALFDAMPKALRVNWPDRHLARQWPQAIASSEHPRHEEAARVLQQFGARLAKRYYGEANRERLLDDRLKWTKFFRDKYEQIVAMADRE